MKENEGIQEAREKLEEISNDEIMQRLADWQESAEHEEAEVRNMGYKEGIKDGEKKIASIVKKLKERNMNINTIAEITGLTIEQIEAIE